MWTSCSDVLMMQKLELWPADMALILSSTSPPHSYICHFSVLALFQTTALEHKREYTVNLLAKCALWLDLFRLCIRR